MSFSIPLPPMTQGERGERLGINGLIRERERISKMCPQVLKPLRGEFFEVIDERDSKYVK